MTIIFDFETDDLPTLKKKKIDDYDLDYGIDVSKSLLDMVGSQIWSPEDVQKMISAKLEEL